MAVHDYTDCNLLIPHKDYLSYLKFDDDGRLTQESLRVVAAMEEDNWKRVEEWANKIGPMICDCDCGGVGVG